MFIMTILKFGFIIHRKSLNILTDAVTWFVLYIYNLSFFTHELLFTVAFLIIFEQLLYIKKVLLLKNFPLFMNFFTFHPSFHF
jgi:hypothetical protein